MNRIILFVIVLLVCFSSICSADYCRLLIICHESFVDYIDDFVKWKYETGWKPHVFEITTEIATNAYLIRTAVVECIDSMDIPPESILIIGSDSFIRLGSMHGATSDAYFADIDSDTRTDIPIGRFPGSDVAEIRSLITKTMNYANNPEVDGDYSWLKKASLLYGFSSDGHYEYFMEELSSILDDYDYDVNMHSSTEGDRIELLKNELYEGLGYIIFRGNGVAGWSGFYIDPDSINNGFHTPIISGTTCATIGNYGPAWVNAGTEDHPMGGVIYIGTNTVSSGHDLMMQRSAMAEGFYQGFLNGMTTGEATENGRQYVLDYGGIDCDREYSSLTMLGDPSIWVWTDIPHEITVEHLSFYNMGDANFDLEVSFEEEPVESALCCISIEDRIYEWGYTDSDGYVEFDYSYSGDCSDSLLISVVGYNLKPYRSKVNFRGEAPRPYVIKSWFDDTETGNGDSLLSRNEVCCIKNVIQNIGLSDCGEITALFTTSCPFITIIDSLINIPFLAFDEEVMPTDCFQIQVHDDAPVGVSFDYTITLTHEDSAYVFNWESPEIVGANIVFSDISIDDAEPWGNNNLNLDYAENAILNIEVSNTGDAAAQDLFLRISCTTDEIIFPYPRSCLQYIEHGTRQNMMPIPIINNPENTSDSIADIVLELTAIDGRFYEFSQTDTIQIKYGNTYTSTTGPDFHGYFIYSNSDISSGRNPSFSWTELSEIGERHRRLSSSTNGIKTIEIPFDFRYYGYDYSEITITTEGYITPGVTYSCESSPDNIPLITYPYPTIAIAWDNLDPTLTGNIFTYNDVENGKFLIQYDNITDSFDKSSTFEIAICNIETYPTPTGDNEIYFYYRDSLYTPSKVIGIQNQTATYGLCYLNNGEYRTSAERIVPETALRITTFPPELEDFTCIFATELEVNDITAGDGDGRCEEGEVIDISVLLENLGTLDAENIRVFLTSSEDRADIAIISDTIYLDELESGRRRIIPDNLHFTFSSLDYIINAAFNIHIMSDDSFKIVQPFYIPLREQLYIEDPQPNDYEMVKTYPNPFNSTINFELPSGHSTIEIYSTDGKLLERHTPQAQSYTLDWHSSEHSTGIYLYRIITNNNECFGKLLFIK